ncbi:MAG: hypothetical protein JXK16_06895 [Thiotrichales bacterium]|nr:hypothetical protein [Thiotrichales bacterium]
MKRRLHNFSVTRIKWLAALLLASVVLAGCSTRFVYNQLDWLAPWYLEDYVTIENYQQDEFSASLDSVLDWHRATQLPLYASFLATLTTELQMPVSKERVAEHFLQLDDFIETVFTRFGRDFSPLMAQMNAEQQAELLENLTDKNLEYYEDKVLIGEAKSKEKSKERLHDFLEDWLDDLTPSQTQMIEQWSADLDWLTPGFYQNRQAWQAHLKTIFADQNANKSQQIEAMFKDRRQFWSDELKQQFAHNQQVTAGFIVQLVNSLDSKQKQLLVKNLKQYEADFRLLASQSN